MKGYTKGRWHAATMRMTKKNWASLHVESFTIVQRGRDIIAAVWCGDDGKDEERCNARLLSAAPEMYEALKEIWDNPSNRSWLASDHGKAIRAAIAKAEGETPAAE